MTDKMTLGKYIEQARIKEGGLSQRKLAQEIKISHSTISRIENDDNIKPDNATLKALAIRLNLDYNYLLALNEAIDDEPEIRIIQRAAKKMDTKDKEKMLNILKVHFDDLFEDEDME